MVLVSKVVVGGILHGETSRRECPDAKERESGLGRNAGTLIEREPSRGEGLLRLYTGFAVRSAPATRLLLLLLLLFLFVGF